MKFFVTDFENTQNPPVNELITDYDNEDLIKEFLRQVIYKNYAIKKFKNCFNDNDDINNKQISTRINSTLNEARQFADSFVSIMYSDSLIHSDLFNLIKGSKL